MDDPIVKEVRETRQRIFKECGEDLDRYIEYLKATEPQDKQRVVTLEEVRARAQKRKGSELHQNI
jgi:hypothetical protein